MNKTKFKLYNGKYYPFGTPALRMINESESAEQQTQVEPQQPQPEAQQVTPTDLFSFLSNLGFSNEQIDAVIQNIVAWGSGLQGTKIVFKQDSFGKPQPETVQQEPPQQDTTVSPEKDDSNTQQQSNFKDEQKYSGYKEVDLEVFFSNPVYNFFGKNDAERRKFADNLRIIRPSGRIILDLDEDGNVWKRSDKGEAMDLRTFIETIEQMVQKKTSGQTD